MKRFLVALLATALMLSFFSMTALAKLSLEGIALEGWIMNDDTPLKDSSGKTLQTLDRGETIIIESIDGDTYWTEYGGSFLKVSASNVSVNYGKKYDANALRKTYGYSFELAKPEYRAATFTKGQKLSVVGRSGNFYGVELSDGSQVNVPAKDVEFAPFTEPKAMVGHIVKDDFTIKVGKININLLTSNSAEIQKAAKKKFVKAENAWGSDYDVAIKAKEATFLPVFEEDEYMSVAILSKYAVTSRGIKLGSTESDMLLAYPDPFTDHVADGVHYYRFVAPGAPFEDFSEDMIAQRWYDRPDWFYEIEIQVNVKTQKVTKIVFAEFLPWA